MKASADQSYMGHHKRKAPEFDETPESNDSSSTGSDKVLQMH